MSIGFRPKGEIGPAYHPDRDYAYLTPTLMCAAIDRLASDVDDELRDWKSSHTISGEEVVLAAEALARAQRDFVNSADSVKSFQQALNRRDWFDLRYAVRQLLFASIGEVFCAAWFTAVRDVSMVNEESPSTVGIADFVARVRQFVGAGVGLNDAERRAALLQLRNDVLQARINTLGEQLKNVTAQLTAAREPVKVAPKAAAWWFKLFSWN